MDQGRKTCQENGVGAGYRELEITEERGGEGERESAEKR